jgi:phosphoadenosine phosphosulfate reductase
MSRKPVQSAQQVIAKALENSGNPCFTCSFQAEDVVLLDLIRKQLSDLTVLFLETGYHFASLIAYRDHLACEWNLNLVNMEAKQTAAVQESEFGKLYETDPNRCCYLRKVEPLLRGIANHDLWFTGLRREQSPSRASLKPFETHRFPDGRTLAKVSPLYNWTAADVFAYLTANDIPVVSLYREGYTSIGCEPCTARPAAGEHTRSGRWGGRKLECGLHTVSDKIRHRNYVLPQ